jgi:hypothetical protein
LTGQTSGLREIGKKDLQHREGLLDESRDYRVYFCHVTAKTLMIEKFPFI